MILVLIRWLLRPVERWSTRAAAACWMCVLTALWLMQLRRRQRAWKTLRRAYARQAHGEAETPGRSHRVQ